MKNIKILIKTVYGNQTIYPNCETSKLLVQLTGKKTFSHRDIKLLQNLGYEFEANNQISSIEQLFSAA